MPSPYSIITPPRRCAVKSTPCPLRPPLSPTMPPSATAPLTGLPYIPCVPISAIARRARPCTAPHYHFAPLLLPRRLFRTSPTNYHFAPPPLEVWPKRGRKDLYPWQSMMGESGHAGRAI